LTDREQHRPGGICWISSLQQRLGLRMRRERQKTNYLLETRPAWGYFVCLRVYYNIILYVCGKRSGSVVRGRFVSLPRYYPLTSEPAGPTARTPSVAGFLDFARRPCSKYTRKHNVSETASASFIRWRRESPTQLVLSKRPRKITTIFSYSTVVSHTAVTQQWLSLMASQFWPSTDTSQYFR
jgi:hypothetical protein